VRLKETGTVRLKNLSTQLLFGIFVAEQCYQLQIPDYFVTLTSCDDGKHGTPTLHGTGNAVDLRTKDFNGDKEQLVRDIKAHLGPDYDVKLEYVGTDNEHIHLEYDPKG
jgi:hypothetical protein